VILFMKILSYEDLAVKMYCKTYNIQYDENQHKENVKSIVTEFYNIQKELLEYLKIDCSLYKIEDRISIIEMIYEFKHLYYSKEEIILFIKDKVRDKEQYTKLIELFSQNINRALNMKQYKNLKICEEILSKESNFDKALKLIKNNIDDNELTLIKRISRYDVSEGLYEDLKRYYFRNDIYNRYMEALITIPGLNYEMASMYSDFLSKLRYRLFEKNLSKESKKNIYNSLINTLIKVKVELDEAITPNKNDEYDLLILFYLRINRLEIARTLEFSNKILRLLNRQSELLKLETYDYKVRENNEKIPNIWRSIVVDQEDLTSSNKRILESDSKDILPIMKNRYKGKFRLLDNDNLKIKKLVLRELYIDKKSNGSKNVNLKQIKKDYNLYEFKLSQIISKIEINKELSDKEEIFIDTLINRGIILEMGNISDSRNVDNLDILISEVLIKIYFLNDIDTINYYVYGLFDVLDYILKETNKNEKK
jgi:hypothetical protein